MQTFQLGEISITRVVESEEHLLTPEETFPDYAKDIFEAHRDWLMPRHYDPDQNKLFINNQSFLVRTPGHTILVRRLRRQQTRTATVRISTTPTGPGCSVWRRPARRRKTSTSSSARICTSITSAG